MCAFDYSAASATATELDDFTVNVASLDDWRTVTAWGNAEGWNIGYRDADCFLPTDPGGFFIGRLGTRPVAAVSLVNLSERYAVWGHYLVDPRFRGRGYGRATCRVARRHAGQRVLASDAMPEQVANYTRSGLVPVHDTIHYVGRPVRTGDTGAEVVRIGPQHLDAIAAYDGESFPAYRRDFLSRWLTTEGHIGYARMRDGQVAGYGVLRPAPACHRIGPLFATTPRDAAVLFDALVAHLGPDDAVSAFAPERPDTDSFFTARGLTEQFRVVRMYKGPAPRTRTDRVFANASLELG